jgi:membrane protein YqaA with SNARE-associated domain
MLMWLGVSLGVAFGSALVPLISMEIFLIGLLTHRPEIPWVALAAVIAVGQVGGKLIHYYAARGSLRLPEFLHRRVRREREPSARRDRWALRTKRIRARLDRLTERCHRHPGWMVGTYGVSSVVGLPPFMATVVLAGLARMNLTAFVTTGLLGRFARFSLLALCPAALAAWHL